MKKKNQVGLFLKAARLKANLTQLEISVKLGYDTPQYISNVERGACTVSIQAMAKFAQVLPLDRDKLVKVVIDQATTQLREALAEGSKLISKRAA